MMTMQDLMKSEVSCSPDGEHWEPALPLQNTSFRRRLRDAWEVWKGEAVAVRQTPKADITKGQL